MEFELLKKETAALNKLRDLGGVHGFFGDEALRFITFAGTLLENDFKLDSQATPSERYLTHVLARSLLENFFITLYIFDDPALTASRFDLLLNSFKDDYRKMLNDMQLPVLQPGIQQHVSQLEPADPTWKHLPGLPNVRDILSQVQNKHGNKLEFLYFTYRITSFDTHGKSMASLIGAAFGKPANFPVLNLRPAFELIANQYRFQLSEFQKAGVI